jgi:hypothetical protein
MRSLRGAHSFIEIVKGEYKAWAIYIGVLNYAMYIGLGNCENQNIVKIKVHVLILVLFLIIDGRRTLIVYYTSPI